MSSADITPLREVDNVDAAFAEGGTDALERAYETYGSMVYTMCRRALGADLAADATQEVFVSAWRARTQFDMQRGSLGGWLTGHREASHHRRVAGATATSRRGRYRPRGRDGVIRCRGDARSRAVVRRTRTTAVVVEATHRACVLRASDTRRDRRALRDTARYCEERYPSRFGSIAASHGARP